MRSLATVLRVSSTMLEDRDQNALTLLESVDVSSHVFVNMSESTQTEDKERCLRRSERRKKKEMLYVFIMCNW